MGNVHTPSIARWKARGRLRICHVELLSLSLTVWKSAFLDGSGVTLSTNFRWKGASSINHCWCQKTRVIDLLCGIKISTVHCLVLSQSIHVTDGQTDSQNYDS